MASISVVIPTIAGREELLKRLLDSIPKHVQRVVVERNDIPLSAKRNYGASFAKGKYIIFIDDDNVLLPGAIDELLKNMTDDVGIMGIVAGYDNDPSRVADGGSKRNMLTGFQKGFFTNVAFDQLPTVPYEVDEVANAFIIKKKIFIKLGGFDELNFPIDLDEADLCRRVKDLGKKVMMCPTARCLHKSITYSWIPDFRRPINAYMMGRNRILFQKKHLSKQKYLLHLLLFLPVFYFGYVAALFYRKKPMMIFHFTKGVIYGLRGCRQNSYQQR